MLLVTGARALVFGACVMVSHAACGGDHGQQTVADAGMGPGDPTEMEWRRIAQQSFATDVSVTLEGPQTAVIGERIELTLKVSNNGPVRCSAYATDVELTPSTTFRGSSANCQEYRPPGGLSCTLPGLEVAETFEATITADISARLPDGFLDIKSNVRILPEYIPDTMPENNSAELRISVTR